MALLHVTSPHTHKPRDTGSVMRLVILATIPGLLAQTIFFGVGTVLNVLLACVSVVLFEAAVMKLRNRPVGFYLRDYSALVTGVLLGLALPPYCPWWLVILGSGFAILLAKQLYGGMGFNPFNPAMVAYIILLISFPLEMSQWAAPGDLLAGTTPGFIDALQQIWLGTPIDAYTAATPLDVVKQNTSLLLDDLYIKESIFSAGQIVGAGWEWVNIGFLLGGLFLLYKKIFSWHAPIGMLAGLSIMAILFYDGGSSTSGGSLSFHLLSGATMLGAFFIVTDPVSSATSTKGRLIYGALIGMLIYIIRVWGNYPDAVAFAVLLMNFAAPFIDYYTVPRTYGHKKPKRATEKVES